MTFILPLIAMRTKKTGNTATRCVLRATATGRRAGPRPGLRWWSLVYRAARRGEGREKEKRGREERRGQGGVKEEESWNRAAHIGLMAYAYINMSHNVFPELLSLADSLFHMISASVIM